ncbi:hypothetical protein [Aneurinibacillus migulanus]|uniref:DdrB-like domain-containing protein n=1 Tax=Aneurinibacillus migulanus TaxID=47500 RepID=A0A1G9AJE5_ANEMI|nr:hypothetical protein [Aneurinibacillus migulanus]MED0891960.1 hypothetical protein [Aneurinibacillus migulanus]MED1617300.1 hypothetical protein [Aneurinibacillus migulanus]GED16557.1 hypothetical protein AMI01nite_45480 [Aneurinibacillus migulanus]SDK26645.1 hypothetical protein SAMN04487909_14630 [Aneurinibacillus migulanus]
MSLRDLFGQNGNGVGPSRKKTLSDLISDGQQQFFDHLAEVDRQADAWAAEQKRKEELARQQLSSLSYQTPKTSVKPAQPETFSQKHPILATIADHAARALFNGDGNFGPMKEIYKGMKNPKPENQNFLNKVGTSLRAGTGDTVKSLGNAVNYLGFENAGKALKEVGEDVTKGFDTKYDKEFSASSLLDPDWYATSVSRSVPTTAGLLVAGLAGGELAGAAAGLTKLGSFGQTVVKGVSGALLGRSTESAMEAGETLEQALERGMSKEEAKKAANSTFAKNMALATTDAAQLIDLFSGGKISSKTLGKLTSNVGPKTNAAFKIGANAAIEGGEEVYQEWAQRSSLGDPFKMDSQTWEAFTIGALMGGTMGLATAARESYNGLKTKAIDNMPNDLRQEYDKVHEQGIKSGMDPIDARDKALDVLSQTPKGNEYVRKIFADSTRDIDQVFMKHAKSFTMNLDTETADMKRAELQSALQQAQAANDLVAVKGIEDSIVRFNVWRGLAESGVQQPPVSSQTQTMGLVTNERPVLNNEPVTKTMQPQQEFDLIGQTDINTEHIPPISETGFTFMDKPSKEKVYREIDMDNGEKLYVTVNDPENIKFMVTSPNKEGSYHTEIKLEDGRTVPINGGWSSGPRVVKYYTGLDLETKPDGSYRVKGYENPNNLEAQPSAMQRQVKKDNTSLEGKTDSAFTPDNQEISFRYAIKDADSLITSNDINIKENPDYPQELQPRDRTREGMVQQINEIAGKLNPKLLGTSPNVSSGAPIIGPDNVVESGNGRTIALKKVYEGIPEKAAEYKRYLTENAKEFGLSAADIENMSKPVLVRVRETEVNRSDFAKKANAPETAALSATEQAIIDADKISQGLMNLFTPDNNGNINTAGNRSFITEFMNQTMSTPERTRYMTEDGALNADGLRRVQNAVFARAYGDATAIEKLAEATETNVQNTIKGMLAAAPRMAYIKQGIENGTFFPVDISSDLTVAMNKLSELRYEGRKVDAYLNQLSMLEEELTPEGKSILRFFDQAKSIKATKEFLLTYAHAVESTGSPNQLGLFGEQPPTKADMLTATFRRIDKNDKTLQATLFADERESRTGIRETNAATGTRNHEESTGKTEKKQRQKSTEGNIERKISKEKPKNNIVKSSETNETNYSIGDKVKHKKTKENGRIIKIDATSVRVETNGKTDIWANDNIELINTLQEAERRMSREVNRNIRGTQEIGIVSKRNKKESKKSLQSGQKSDYAFENPEIEAQWQASGEREYQTIREKLAEKWEIFKRQFTREFEHLPHNAEFSQLRNDLLNLRRQRGVADDRTLRIIQGLIVGLNKKQYDLFERSVVLNDLVQDAKKGRKLPFGFDESTLIKEHERLMNQVNKEVEVKKAIEERKKVWDAIKTEYVSAMKQIGFDVSDRFTNNDYFRHIVLTQVEKNRTKGTGKKLKTPTGSPYLKKREGSDKNILRNYIEAEHDVMSHMLFDREAARVIKMVNDKYNVFNSLQKQAQKENEQKFEEIVRQEKQDGWRSLPKESLAALESYARLYIGDMALNQQTLSLKGIEEESMIERVIKKFGQYQGMSFGKIEALAKKDKLWTGENQEYKDVVNQLAAGKKEDNKKVYQYLSELAQKDEIGSIEAKTILKYSALRREFKNDILGSKHVTWESLIPEGYTTWQPREGNLFFMSNTIPEHMAKSLFEGAAQMLGVTKNDIRQAMTVGGKRTEFVVKEEVAKTLDNLFPDSTPDMLLKANARFMNWLKKFQLQGPTRVIKYNLRNITGDIDKTLAGNAKDMMNGKMISYVKRAATELYDVIKHDRAMSADMKDWFERGGIMTMRHIQDVKSVSQLKMFAEFQEYQRLPLGKRVVKMPKHLWSRYWSGAESFSNYLGSLFRYANYLSFLEQIKKNNGKPDSYGASIPEEIDALSDPRDKAFKLSNELLGAYDSVSVFGNAMRTHLVPYYSFTETNFRGYIQLVKNAAQNESIATAAGKKILGSAAIRAPYLAYRMGSLALKISGFTILIALWNNLMFGDEEDEIPERERQKTHIILGRNSKGEVLYFSRVGTLDDFLEWFGIESMTLDARDIIEGRRTFKEVATENLSKPVVKVAGMMNNIPKMMFEIISGQSYYPDPKNPKEFGSIGEYIANVFGVKNEYKYLEGLPKRPYSENLDNFLWYKSDPRETAYYETLSNKRRFLNRIGRGTSGGISTEKSATLHNLKQAIKYQDQKAIKKYAQEYIKLGGTDEGFERSMKSMHPLFGMKDEVQEQFINSLPPNDKEKLKIAIEYYKTTLNPMQ